MIRKLIISLALTGFILGQAGCSFFKKDDEGAADSTAELTEDGDISEIAEDGGDFGDSEFSDEQVAEGGDFPADDSGFDDSGATDTAMTDEGMGDFAGGDTGDLGAPAGEADPFAEDMAANETPPPADTTDNLSAGSTDYADSSSYYDSSLSSDEMAGLSEEPPAPRFVPLRKIETTPWRQAGVLLNGVYVARPGDDFNSVSQKIYGSDEKVAELKKVNPTIARRAMKVGDKIYYNSPRRPTDENLILTFYEDVGLTPEMYISQPGDNIREVSTRLLGHKDSWKEIWATNLDVESKSDLPEGTQLRYWPGEVSSPAPVVADTAPPAMDMAMNAPPPQDDFAPPPPMPDEAPVVPPPATAEMNEPPPPMEPPPPPPPVAEVPPAPVMPPQVAQAPPPAASPLDEFLGEGDQASALMIGAILLIAAVALFIVIRKRKARRNIDFHTATHTQIE